MQKESGMFFRVLPHTTPWYMYVGRLSLLHLGDPITINCPEPDLVSALTQSGIFLSWFFPVSEQQSFSFILQSSCSLLRTNVLHTPG